MKISFKTHFFIIYIKLFYFAFFILAFFKIIITKQPFILSKSYKQTFFKMNLFSQQLHQKNSLLRTYQQQNYRLKTILNKQKNSHFLKLPKQTTSVHTINNLQTQNLNLKRKLDSFIMNHNELLNKIEKQKMFNRKLQTENKSLNIKVKQLTESLENQKQQKFVDQVGKGVANMSLFMVGNQINKPNLTGASLQNMNPKDSFHQSFLLGNRQSDSPQNNINNFISNRQSYQPLYSTNQSSYPHNQLLINNPNLMNNQIIVRSLHQHKQKQSLQNQIHFLNKQLQKTKEQLQKTRDDLDEHKTKLRQIQQINDQYFTYKMENDKISGQLAQAMLVKSLLEQNLRKVQEENNYLKIERQNNVKELVDDNNFMKIQNEELKRNVSKQERRRQTVQKALRQSYKKQITESQYLRKTTKALQNSELITCKYCNKQFSLPRSSFINQSPQQLLKQQSNSIQRQLEHPKYQQNQNNISSKTQMLKMPVLNKQLKSLTSFQTLSGKNSDWYNFSLLQNMDKKQNMMLDKNKIVSTEHQNFQFNLKANKRRENDDYRGTQSEEYFLGSNNNYYKNNNQSSKQIQSQIKEGRGTYDNTHDKRRVQIDNQKNSTYQYQIDSQGGSPYKVNSRREEQKRKQQIEQQPRQSRKRGFDKNKGQFSQIKEQIEQQSKLMSSDPVVQNDNRLNRVLNSLQMQNSNRNPLLRDYESVHQQQNQNMIQPINQQINQPINASSGQLNQVPQNRQIPPISIWDSIRNALNFSRE